MQDLQSPRNHLFISYATEDWHLAEWLAFKLTNEGYKVWCDRHELLGGESYPLDIDKAITDKTFRLLALLSKNSVNKPNPTKERTLALNISNSRKIDFMIPLNVDGLRSTELGWMNSDLTYIPFNNGWGNGLKQILKKLEDIDTPKDKNVDGKILSKLFLENEDKYISTEGEEIHTNMYQFMEIPSKVKKIHLNKMIEPNNLDNISFLWSSYFIDAFTIASLETPPIEIAEELDIRATEYIQMDFNEKIEGIPILNIVKSLLKKSIEISLLKKGLSIANNGKIYFPDGISEQNRINFKNNFGEKTYLKVAGLRDKTKENRVYRYHLAPKFKIIKDDGNNFFAQLIVQLHLTNKEGYPLNPRSALSRRKKLCKNWWNEKWLLNNFAVMGFLSDKEDKIIIGENDGKIVLSNIPIKLTSPIKLIENPEMIEEENQVREQIINIEDGEDFYEI